MKNTTAEVTIEKFRKIFTTHGLTSHVITDSGTQFISEECQNFFKRFGIKQEFAAPKHPATNGASKIF